MNRRKFLTTFTGLVYVASYALNLESHERPNNNDSFNNNASQSLFIGKRKGS